LVDFPKKLVEKLYQRGLIIMQYTYNLNMVSTRAEAGGWQGPGPYECQITTDFFEI
jgi:hypothetical protein